VLQDPAILTHHKSNTVYLIHSDVGYLNKQMQLGMEHHFISKDTAHPPNNGTILTVAKIIKGVMSSVAEEKMGALSTNAPTGVAVRTILSELGHLQLQTPVQTNNSTVKSIIMINSRGQPTLTKAMDMRFHWLCECSVNLKQLPFYWWLGPTNFTYYWSKNHPASNHCNVYKIFLMSFKKVLKLWAHQQQLMHQSSLSVRVC
jgi:hypothetical protein